MNYSLKKISEIFNVDFIGNEAFTINKVSSNFSKENIEVLKDKIKNEMKTAINKEVFISKEDAQIINGFLDKIITDLNRANK